MNKPKLLVLTSSYPKYKGDINGNFVYELTVRLKDNFSLFILVPSYAGSLKFELIEEIKIFRHKQFFFNIDLAYGIGIYENLKKNKLKYFIIPFYFLFQILALNKIIRKEHINIVHAYWLIPNAFFAVICKKIFHLEYKIIATILGSDFWGFNNKIGYLIKKFTLGNIDELTVVSNAIKEKVIEFGYSKKIYVYPMGVDTNRFSPVKKNEIIKIKHKIEKEFLLFVGTIVEQKGIRVLIQSMSLILKKHPVVKLVIIGEGILKNDMIKLSKDLHVSNNIIFTGVMPYDDLPSYFATADLLILPSFSEGWPVVVMEALSSGTPVIVTNIPVFDKHERKNELFFVVPAGDPKSLSDKVIEVLSGNLIQMPFNDKLRYYAQNYLDWTIISDRYKTLIDRTNIK